MPGGLVKNDRAVSQQGWRLTAECDTNRGRQERRSERPAGTAVIPGRLDTCRGWALREETADAAH